jgi:hypothetical protein
MGLYIGGGGFAFDTQDRRIHIASQRYFVIMLRKRIYRGIEHRYSHNHSLKGLILFHTCTSVSLPNNLEPRVNESNNAILSRGKRSQQQFCPQTCRFPPCLLFPLRSVRPLNSPLPLTQTLTDEDGAPGGDKDLGSVTVLVLLSTTNEVTTTVVVRPASLNPPRTPLAFTPSLEALQHVSSTQPRE